MSARGDIDTGNEQLVSRDGDGTVRIQLPCRRMTSGDALRLAAWLVVVADPVGDEFEAVLSAVRNT